MAVLYKNENNIYAYRDTEGHWVFSREANIGTDDYIMKSTTADKLKPYDPGIMYVTKTNEIEKPVIDTVYEEPTPDPEPDPDYTAILTEYAEAAEASANTAAAGASALDERVDDLKELSNLLTTIIG